MKGEWKGGRKGERGRKEGRTQPTGDSCPMHVLKSLLMSWLLWPLPALRDSYQ